MTPVIAKAIFALLVVGWYAIRAPHEWRAWHMPVSRSARDYRELAVILIAIVGLGTLPLLYIATGFPQFADYPFNRDASVGRSHRGNSSARHVLPDA